MGLFQKLNVSVSKALANINHLNVKHDYVVLVDKVDNQVVFIFWFLTNNAAVNILVRIQLSHSQSTLIFWHLLCASYSLQHRVCEYIILSLWSSHSSERRLGRVRISEIHTMFDGGERYGEK